MNDSSLQEGIKIMREIFEEAKSGDSFAKTCWILLQHGMVGQRLSGITTREAIEMVKNLGAPDEWKLSMMQFISKPVKEREL